MRYKIDMYQNGDPSMRNAVGEINENTYKFYTNRFVVLRNFIPKEIIEFTMDVWKTIEAQPELN